MTSKTAFSEEEWFLVANTPTLVGAAVMKAGRSGIAGTMKEALAGLRALTNSKTDFPNSELIQSLTAPEEYTNREEANAGAQEKLQEIQAAIAERGLKSSNAFSEAAVADCLAAITLLNKRALRSEVADYKALIIKVAQEVAEAAKEGGFLGLGGKRVSDAEEALIGRIQTALNASANDISYGGTFSGDDPDGWSNS